MTAPLTLHRQTLGGRPQPQPGWSASAAGAFVVAVLSAAALAGIYSVFVLSSWGQHVDQAALEHLAQSTTPRATLSDWLREVTVGSIGLVVIACVAVALARRRWAVAIAAVVLVAGANITTQLLKHVILERPNLGHETVNSLPSGHTTVVASLVMAALLVAPSGWRALISLAGATALAVTGVGTVVANWHRPSDVVAAFAVVMMWAAIVVIPLSVRPSPTPERSPRSHPLALMVGLAVSAGLFLAVGVRPNGSDRDLVVHVVIMCGIALAGAFVVGLYSRMLAARAP